MKKLYHLRYLTLVLVIFISCSYPTEEQGSEVTDGKVLHLNGDKQYFKIPDIAELNLDENKSLSIEMWINLKTSGKFNLINKLQILEIDSKGFPNKGLGMLIDISSPEFYYTPPRISDFNIGEFISI